VKAAPAEPVKLGETDGSCPPRNVPADARPRSGSPRATRGPHRRWTRNDHRSRRAPRAAGNEPSVLAARPRPQDGARACRQLTCQSRCRRARRGWNNVTAGDLTVWGVTLWSSAGHNVTCPGATLPVCHVWRPAGASGLADALDPPASPINLRLRAKISPRGHHSAQLSSAEPALHRDEHLSNSLNNTQHYQVRPPSTAPAGKPSLPVPADVFCVAHVAALDPFDQPASGIPSR
jgi:hypothetical protein